METPTLTPTLEHRYGETNMETLTLTPTMLILLHHITEMKAIMDGTDDDDDNDDGDDYDDCGHHLPVKATLLILHVVH